MSVQGNGTSTYLASTSTISAPITYSIAFWYNPTHLPQLAPQRVGFGLESSGTYDINFSWDHALAAYYKAFAHLNADNVTITVCQYPTVPPANTWHHYAVTWDGTTMKIYLDGDIQNSVTGSSPAPAQGNPLVYVLAHPGSGNFDNANIAEVGVWNVALTAAQVASLYSGALVNTVQLANVLFYDALNGAGAVVGPTLTNHGAVFSANPTLFAGQYGGNAFGGNKVIANPSVLSIMTGGNAVGGGFTFAITGFDITFAPGGNAVGGNAMVVTSQVGNDGAFVIASARENAYTTRL